MQDIRHGSQIWLQLSEASPTNRPQPKVIITTVIIKLKLWLAAGCEAKVVRPPKIEPGPYCTIRETFNQCVTRRHKCIMPDRGKLPHVLFSQFTEYFQS